MTNRPDLIDDALMRPGRFEVKMEIGEIAFFFSLLDPHLGTVNRLHEGSQNVLDLNIKPL